MAPLDPFEDIFNNINIAFPADKINALTKAFEVSTLYKDSLSKLMSNLPLTTTQDYLGVLSGAFDKYFLTTETDLARLEKCFKDTTLFNSVLDKNLLLSNNLESVFHRIDAFSDSILMLSKLTKSYDCIIVNQKISLQQNFNLEPYQKRYLTNHEQAQKKAISIGFQDIENVEIVNANVENTISLINGFAKIESDTIGEISTEIEEDLYESLIKRGLGYVEALNGAKQSARSTNPDKARHTITSLRELSTHILHELSPDEDIKKWTTNRDYFVDNRPTRKCRLEYIMRNNTGSKIKPFIQNEIRFIKDFFDMFNSGTHSLKSDFTDDELIYLINKTESTLLLLLKSSHE